jgi:hypothetical protein
MTGTPVHAPRHHPPRRAPRLLARAGLSAALAVVCVASTAQAQTFIWQGGDGNWFDNANWNDPAEPWTSGTNRQAILQGTAGTIDLGGQEPTTFLVGSNNATTPNGGIQINSSGTWALTSGTINNRNWVFGQGLTGVNATLRLDDIVLTNTASFSFLRAAGNTGTVVLENLANSQVPELVFWGGMTLHTNASTNLGSIGGLDFKDGTTFIADAPLTLPGLVKSANVTYDVNDRVRFGSMAYQGGSITRTITVAGSGTLSIGTWNVVGTAASGSATWTKSGTGTLEVDTLNNTSSGGTINRFNVNQGRMLFNGTSTNLGTVSVSSGATVGGIGSIGFSGTNSLSVAAGGFMTADMTAGGLDILGTLALAQTGTGVTLRLDGLLPTTGTTTLLSWTSLLDSGTFRTITYDTGTGLATLTPDLADPVLNGGRVSYTAVPNSIVFIAVPEPATICLLAGGAALLGGREIRRRRRRRSDPADRGGPPPGRSPRP